MPASDALLSVAMARCKGYDQPALEQTVSACLDAANVADAAPLGRGSRVLVKPNLIKATPDGLCCTHPGVVRAACLWLLDKGARPFVGDSPAFGSGRGVARRIGLNQALDGLDIEIVNLSAPVRRKLPFGYHAGISRLALEADAVLNIPRLKAHCQMVMSGAVKNLFGCITGTRKAVAHTLHGDVTGPNGPRFESLMIELAQELPPTVALMDAVVAMQGQGPTSGEPVALEMLAASPSCVALDTAVYTMLCLEPQQVPLWCESQRRELAGSRPEELYFPMLQPSDFDGSVFSLPSLMLPMTFHPGRLCVSAVCRAWARIK